MYLRSTSREIPRARPGPLAPRYGRRGETPADEPSGILHVVHLTHFSGKAIQPPNEEPTNLSGRSDKDIPTREDQRRPNDKSSQHNAPRDFPHMSKS